MDRQDVTPRGQFGKIFAPNQPPLSRSICGERSAPGDHVHLECSGALGYGLANSPQPNNAKRSTLQPSGASVFLLVPAPVAQVFDILADSAIQPENQRKGQFRHGDSVLARAVGHQDAAQRGRAGINRVDPGAGADDEV